MSYDALLMNEWNTLRPDQLICEEQVWDLCRVFESEGMLEGNTRFVGVRSIGPFHIAYQDVSRIDAMQFFATELIPALIMINNNLAFEDIYVYFLCPVAMLFAKMVNGAYLIKDPLEWEILLLVRNLNKENVYPLPKEILARQEFQNFDKLEVYNACKSLLQKKSVLDNNKMLIQKDHDGRLECSV